jgi:hypothetical protein
MQKAKTKPIQSRLIRLEDAVLSLIQLNKIFSEEADLTKNRLKKLESRDCACLRNAREVEMINPLASKNEHQHEGYSDVTLRFDTQNQYTYFYLDGRLIYDISVDEFSDAVSALDWIRQISQKSWATTQTIDEICTLVIGALKNGR